MPIENVGRLAAFSDTQAAISAATAGLSEIRFARRTSDNALGFTVDGGVTWYYVSGTGGGGATLDPSTPQVISGSGNAGTSASAAAGDHTHKGVASISSSGNAPSYGGITFIPGTNASISMSGGSITISGGSGAGGSFTLNANNQPILNGQTTLVAGTNITLSQTSASITINGNNGSGIVPQIFGGRLTYDGSNSVPGADVTGASVVWYAPYLNNQISLYASTSAWRQLTFTAPSLALTGLSPNSAYDVFGFYNVSELTLEATRWKSSDNTVRLMGLSAQDGTQVMSTNPTRLYLGTMYIGTTSGQSDDAQQKRHLWNNYNKVGRKMLRQEPSAAWTYNSAVLRQANGSSANFLSAVTGIADNPVNIGVTTQITNNGVAGFGIIAIGVDSTTVNSADVNAEAGLNTTTAIHLQITATLDHQAIGYHSYNWLESVRSGSMNFDPLESTENMKNGMWGRTIG